MLPPNRNQSNDFQCKSIDWFLYDANTGLKWYSVLGKNISRPKITFFDLKGWLTKKTSLLFKLFS